VLGTNSDSKQKPGEASPLGESENQETPRSLASE